VSEPNRRAAGRHRISGEELRRAALAKLGTAALVLGTLAVGTVLLPLKPHGIAFQRPFVRTGTVGQPVDARLFRVTVLDATGGVKINGKSPVETTGVWIVVHVKAVATTEPTAIGYAALRDERGRTFRYTDKVDQPFVLRGLQPGIPVEGQIAFEIPRDAVGRLVARFARSNELSLEAVAEVPLPIIKADVDAWLAEKKLIQLYKPEVVE
jgi:hypothetical protein